MNNITSEDGNHGSLLALFVVTFGIITIALSSFLIPQAHALSATNTTVSLTVVRSCLLDGNYAALRRLGEPAVRSLIAILQDDDAQMWRRAAEALATFGTQSAGHVLPLLQHANVRVRICAVGILGRMGSETAIPALVHLTIDPAPEIRGAASEALGRIGRPKTRILVEALHDLDPLVRQYAAATLGDIGMPEVVPQLIEARHHAIDPLLGAIDHALSQIANRQTIVAERKPDRSPRGGVATEFVKADERWTLLVDGQVFPQTFGIVYQPVPEGRHINDYETDISSLYFSLLDVAEGGKGHAKRIREMGVYVVRVYSLPTAPTADVDRTKAIFRRVYQEYGIRVLVGHYVGLYASGDFNNSEFRQATTASVQALVNTYGHEPWVLGWQLGNENNFYVEEGSLETRINLSLEEYYFFMDQVAKAVRNTPTEEEVRHFVILGNGDLKREEAELISRLSNFDGLGINAYRNSVGMAAIAEVAERHLRIPLILSEFGHPSLVSSAEQPQFSFYRDLIPYIRKDSRESGRTSQIVLAFISEATDEQWKNVDLADPAQGHLGVFEKDAEPLIASLMHEYDREDRYYALPTFKSAELNDAAWALLDSYQYEHALAYAEAVTRMYGPLAKLQQEEANLRDIAGARDEVWALNDVGAALLIRIRALWESGAQREAKVVYADLVQNYGRAELRGNDGHYRNTAYCARKLFPKMFPRWIFRTPLEIAVGALLLVVFVMSPALLRFAKHLLRWVRRLAGRALEAPPTQEPILSPKDCFGLFGLVLVHGCLVSDFAGWWLHPVRYDHYVVSMPLFGLLTYIGAFGFLFHWLILYFVCAMRRPLPIVPEPASAVALVTTYVESEPLSLVQNTLLKMCEVVYEHDNFVLDESNNPQLALFCRDHGIFHFSRRDLPRYQQDTPPFQARTKGGNLNAWLDRFGDRYEFVTFFDCDHQPHESYLHRVLGYFTDHRVACVQSPNVYGNTTNWIARGNIEPNAFFVGPIQTGLYAHGAPLVNGSHSTFRVAALHDIGLYAVHLADDILTGLRLCARKWKVLYVPEVLAEGLAPIDWSGTLLQQYRWSQSMFDLLIFKYPLYILQLRPPQILAFVTIGIFYFLQVNFVLLVFIPIIATVMNQSPANVDLNEFLLRFGPLYLLQLGTLTLWGQRFVIRPEQERGLWWRCGLVEIAGSVYVIYAFLRAALRLQLDRRTFVASKNSSVGVSLSRTIKLFLPHIGIAGVSLGVLIFSLISPESHWQTEGMQLFLGMNAIIFGGLVWTAVAKRV